MPRAGATTYAALAMLRVNMETQSDPELRFHREPWERCDVIYILYIIYINTRCTLFTLGSLLCEIFEKMVKKILDNEIKWIKIRLWNSEDSLRILACGREGSEFVEIVLFPKPLNIPTRRCPVTVL